ncbi:transport protein TonB [Rhodobiaceae bacterium]|nr:transport protein TonB [Rhodobiaceae bacterium]
MSVADPDQLNGFEAPRLRTVLLWSVGLHLLVLVYFLLGGGIFGSEGPGDGDALTFQLAAGLDNNDDAAAQIDGSDQQTPTFADADIDPVPEPTPEPEPKPEPKPEVKPEPKPQVTDQLPTRRNEDVQPQQAATTQQRGEEEVATPGGSTGIVGYDHYGGGGNLEETIRNRPGNSLTGNAISARLTGQTLFLEMGRLDIQGGNRLTNVEIQLNADGTSRVKLIYYHYKTYHREHSSTRSKRGSGRWWIEGNRWCHQSEIISYGTKDCYDMNLDGSVLRLYYAECLRNSSPHCKSYRLAGEGSIR